jgi:hypothetical protein
MSTAHTNPAPIEVSRKRKSMLARITGGAVLATGVTVATIALWPASATETAHADGKHVGQAVSDLYYANSSEDVDAALADLDQAVSDTRTHASDYVGDQVSAQEDALNRAADGFVGSRTTDSDWDADLYQSELDIAVDDLNSQASNFRTEAPEVEQAFWDGVNEGLAID